jgi:hypothetical protein
VIDVTVQLIEAWDFGHATVHRCGRVGNRAGRVLLPLAAQPASSAAAPALSGAMFLCRGPNDIDRACVAALAQSLVLNAAGNGANKVAQHVCHMDHTTLASLARRN